MVSTFRLKKSFGFNFSVYSVFKNLEYGSRQIMANQIGPHDHNGSDWSTANKSARGLLVANVMQSWGVCTRVFDRKLRLHRRG